MDKKVGGTVTVKNNTWYCILYIYVDGKRHPKWVSTKLPKKGNKTRAEEMLRELQDSYSKMDTVGFKNKKISQSSQLTANMDFSDYLLEYLEIIKYDIQTTTYDGYISYIRGWNRYCTEIKTRYKLKDITESVLTKFYHNLLDKGCKSITINHYMTLFNPAIKYAYKKGIIWKNPIEDMHRYPKDKTFKGTFYTPEECDTLIAKLNNNRLQLFYKTSLYLGTRCSETLGIRFSSIDFDNNLIHIDHKVLYKSDNLLIKSSELKSRTSLRTLPLPEDLKKDILERKALIEREMANNPNYLTRDIGYLFVNKNGCLYRNSYLSNYLRVFLKRNALRPLRLHDLRHTTASLMSIKNVPLTDIRDYLGHSDITTTGIYAGSNFEQIKKANDTLISLFNFAQTNKNQE